MTQTITINPAGQVTVSVPASKTQSIVATGVAFGAAGASATVAAGTATPLSAGSSPTVANVGTPSAAVFNFGIPSGMAGINGTNGATWRDGAGAPSNALGVDGDYYLNDATGDVYLRASGIYSIIANIKGTTGSTGSTGAAGTNGTNGSTWYEGAGAPSTTHTNGDYYLNTTNGDVYVQAAGAWGSPVGNIKGPTGTGTGDMLLGTAQTVTAAKTFNAGMMLDKGEIVYDVKAYGATGNGSTDDTAAIQSAIDTANTNGGGEVRFPAGTYKISASLKLYSGVSPTITAYKNLKLVGAGGAGGTGTIINQVTTSEDIIKGLNDSANSAQVRNIVIKDMYLAFAGATLTNSGNGIYLKQQAANGPAFDHFYMQGVVVANCQGTGKYGFNFESMIVSTMENCEAVVCANGFYFNGGAFGNYTSVNTSITLINCYANMSTNGVIGYNTYQSTYMSFISCACDWGVNGTSGYINNASNCITYIACGVELNGTVTLTNGFLIEGASSSVGLYQPYVYLSKSTILYYVTGSSIGVHLDAPQDNSSVSGSTGLKVDAGSVVAITNPQWQTVATTVTNAGTLTTLNDTGAATFPGYVSIGGAIKIPNYGSLQNTAGVNLATFGAAGTAVNYLSFEAEATGLAPTIYPTGSDTNISLNLQGKGTGVVQIAGVKIPTITSTDTLTNKRLSKRIYSTTSTGTPSVSTDTYDQIDLTAQAAAITSFTLSGTPTDGQETFVRIKATGAYAITAPANVKNSGVASFPTTTVSGKTISANLRWDSTAAMWICLAVDTTGY
jgi:hypothetical protein